MLLYKGGPKKAKDITSELKIQKRKVYRILKKLQETKIIQAIATKPTQYPIVSFDNFLDLLINNRLSEIRKLADVKNMGKKKGDASFSLIMYS